VFGDGGGGTQYASRLRWSRRNIPEIKKNW